VSGKEHGLWWMIYIEVGCCLVILASQVVALKGSVVR
jgi:hypothetical protein